MRSKGRHVYLKGTSLVQQEARKGGARKENIFVWEAGIKVGYYILFYFFLTSCWWGCHDSSDRQRVTQTSISLILKWSLIWRLQNIKRLNKNDIEGYAKHLKAYRLYEMKKKMRVVLQKTGERGEREEDVCKRTLQYNTLLVTGKEAASVVPGWKLVQDDEELYFIKVLTVNAAIPIRKENIINQGYRDENGCMCG